MTVCLLKLSRQNGFIGFRPIYRVNDNCRSPYQFLVSDRDINRLLHDGSAISRDIYSFLELWSTGPDQVSARFTWLQSWGNELRGKLDGVLQFRKHQVARLLSAPPGTEVSILIKDQVPKTKFEITPRANAIIRELSSGRSLRRKLGKAVMTLNSTWADSILIAGDGPKDFYFRSYCNGNFVGNGGIILSNEKYEIHT